MGRYIALLRGINVGKAKRVAMADLRELVHGLGHSNARTLLNSGNVVFDTARAATPARVAAALESAVESHCGFKSAVTVVSADALDAIVRGNVLAAEDRNPARMLVAFVSDAATLATTKAIAAQRWDPDEFALGPHAAYLWCASGILDSKLAQAFARATRDGATTRNWATVLKLQAMTAE
ncbi:MAG TPA: DUF1697 domain-containing protein [Burkholderiaceae bacterium]|nr:DUF1697 domain-containing protein [Burkholderiaceae bacterium]